MCDQTEVEYTAGEIVWCKLSNVWWPAQVQNESNLDEEVTQGLKKKPLAIVKFFDEDMYDFVKDINQICSYNSAKKFEFIRKGMDLYRKGGDKNQMNKFPIDIVKAEELTGGDVNILDDPRVAPEEKINIKEIFSTPKQEKNNKKSKNSTVKTKNTGHSYALARLNGLALKKGYFTKDLVQESKEQIKNEYKCNSCSFVASRLSTLYDHSRYNIHCSKVVSAKLTKSNSSSVKLEKSPVKRKSVVNSDGPVVKKKPKVLAKSPSEPKKIIKVKTMSVKEIKEKDKKNAEEEIGKLLLQDWEDEDEFGEDTDTPADCSPEKTEGKNNLEDAEKKIDCFDFEENEEDIERNIRFGQKLPRVIPKDDKVKENKAKDKVNDEDDTLELEFKNIMNETAVPIVTDPFLLDSSVLPGCSGKAEKNLGLEAKVEILTGGSENGVKKESCMKSDDDNTSLLRALGCDSPAEPTEPQTELNSKKRVNTTVSEVIKKFKSDKELLESLRSDSDDNSCSVDNNNLMIPTKTESIPDQTNKAGTTDFSKTPKASSSAHVGESLDKAKSVKKISENINVDSKIRKSRSSRRLSSAADAEAEKKKGKNEERNENKTVKIEKKPVSSSDAKPVKKETPSKELSAADTRTSRRLNIKTPPKTQPAEVKELQHSGANKSNNPSLNKSDKKQVGVKKEQRLSSSRESFKPNESVKFTKSSDTKRPSSKSPVKKLPQLTEKMDLPDDEKLLDSLLAQVFSDSSLEKKRKSSDKGIKHRSPEKIPRKGVDNPPSAKEKPTFDAKKVKLDSEKTNIAKKAYLDKPLIKDRTIRHSPSKVNKPIDDKSKPKANVRKSREEVRRSIEEERQNRMGEKSSSKDSKSSVKSPVHMIQKSKTELKGSKETISSQSKSKEPQSKNIGKNSEKLPVKNDSVKGLIDSPKPLVKSPERKTEIKIIKKESPLASLFANRRDEKSPKSGKSKRPVIDKSIIDLFTPDIVKTVVPSKSTSGSSAESGSSLKRRDSIKSPTKEKPKKEEKSKDSSLSPVKSPKYEVSSSKLSAEHKSGDDKLVPSLVSSPQKIENSGKDNEPSLIDALGSPNKKITESVLSDDKALIEQNVDNNEVKIQDARTSLVNTESPDKPEVTAIPHDLQTSEMLIEEAPVPQSIPFSDEHSSNQLELDSKNNENVVAEKGKEMTSVENELVTQTFEDPDSKSQETISHINAELSECAQNLKESESPDLVVPDHFLDVTKVPPLRDKVEEILNTDNSVKLELSDQKAEETKKDFIEGSPISHNESKIDQIVTEMSFTDKAEDKYKEREEIGQTETVPSNEDNTNIEKVLKIQNNFELNAISQEVFTELTDNIDQEMEEMFYDGDHPCKAINTGSISSPSKEQELSSGVEKENRLPFTSDESQSQVFDSKGESLIAKAQKMRNNDSSDFVIDQVKKQDDNSNNGDEVEVINESVLPLQESSKILNSESDNSKNDLIDASLCQGEELTPAVSQSLCTDIPSQIAEDLPETSETFNLNKMESNDANQISNVTNSENDVKDTLICQEENPIPLVNQFHPVNILPQIPETSEASNETEEIDDSHQITDSGSIGEAIEATNIKPTVVDDGSTFISENLPEAEKLHSTTTKISSNITDTLPNTAEVLPSVPEVESCKNELSPSKSDVSAEFSSTTAHIFEPTVKDDVNNQPSVVSFGPTEVTIDDSEEESDNIEQPLTEVVIDSHYVSPEKKSSKSCIQTFSNDYFENDFSEEVIKSKPYPSPGKTPKKTDDTISLITPEKSKDSLKKNNNSIDTKTCEDLEPCNEQIIIEENVSDEVSVPSKMIENDVKGFRDDLISKTEETIVLPTITESCSLTSSETSDNEKCVGKDLETEFPDYNDKFDVVSEVVISDDKMEDESNLYNFDDQVGTVVTPQYTVKKTKPFGDVKINFSSKPNNLMMGLPQEFSQKVVSADFLTPDKIKAIYSKKEDATGSTSIKPCVVPPQSQFVDSSPKVLVSTSSQQVNPFSADFQNMELDINSMPIVIADDNELVSSMNSSISVCNQVVTSASLPKLVMTTTMVPALVSSTIPTSSPSLSVPSVASSTLPTVSTLVSSTKPQPTGSQARRLTIAPYKEGNKKYDLFIKLVPSNKFKLAPNSNCQVIKIPGKKKLNADNRIIKIFPQKKNIVRQDTKELYIMTSAGKKRVVFKADVGSSILNKAVSLSSQDSAKSIVIKQEPPKSIVVALPEASTSGRRTVTNVSSRTIHVLNHKINVINKPQIPSKPNVTSVQLVPKTQSKPLKSKKIQSHIESTNKKIKMPNILGSKSSLLKPSILKKEVKLSPNQVGKGFIKISSAQLSEASQLIASTKASFDTMNQGRATKVSSPKQDILAKALGDTLEIDDMEEVPIPVAKQTTQPVKAHTPPPVSTSYSVHQLPITFQNNEIFLPSMPVIAESIIPQRQPVFQIDCSQILTHQNSHEVNLAEIELPADPPPPLDVPNDVSSIPLPPEPSQNLTPPPSLPELMFQTQPDQKFTLFQNIGNS